MAAVADVIDNTDDMFVFTCTSDYGNVANMLIILKSQLGSCVDSGASHHYSPHHNTFIKYCPIHNQSITAADGQKLKAVSMGDVEIELLNGAKCKKLLLKDAIYTPNMAFTLISVSCLDEANGSAIFSMVRCIVATILHADILYCIIPVKELPLLIIPMLHP